MKTKKTTFAQLSADFFAGNRRRLLSELQFGALVVIGANSKMQRSGDTAFAFEQYADFWYLSGIAQADWWLIIDGVSGRSWLVHPDIDDVRRRFDGELDSTQAQSISGVDAVIDYTEARQLLAKLAKKHTIAHTSAPDPRLKQYGFVVNPGPQSVAAELHKFDVRSCRREIARLRAIKQAPEIAMIQQAIDITEQAFLAVDKSWSSFTHEAEIEAQFSYEFRRRRSSGHAYDPIVAAGEHACTLHYNHNDGAIRPKSLVLMDVGARYGKYCADITRTYSAAPTAYAKKVMAAVDAVRQYAIGLCTPGRSFEEYQRLSDAFMTEQLSSLGLITKDADETALRRYFPHAISHGLGLDVHDSLGGYTTFRPGMVLTVEPGIYIDQKSIGVRIEDNILITDGEPRNLSAEIRYQLTS